MANSNIAAILDLALQKASNSNKTPIINDAEIVKRIELVATNAQNRACVRFIMACSLAKIDKPMVDIRKPYTEIGGDDSFSGRMYDELYITDFIKNNELPCNSTTAFLIPAFRNRSIVLTPYANLIGRPESVYNATLQLLDDVYQKRLTAEELLAETIRWLLIVKPFLKSSVSAFTSVTEKKLKVFLCHASGDKPVVEKYYDLLTNDGIDAWLDKKNLIPGQDWQLEIPKAVKNSHIVIVFLSSSSTTKEGYVQKEIRTALDTADEKPDGTIFIIPARLENCEVPERLKKFHWVDLFEKDGYECVLKALRMRSHSLGIVINSKDHEELEAPQRRKEEGSKHHPFDTEKIVAWDWSGVDIRKESHNFRADGRKDPDSIMYRVIRELRKDDYQVIFDDDGAGEAADIVTIKISEKSDKRKTIMIEFYHCKYSNVKHPGSRINELYEVCGQATKSAVWIKSRTNQEDLFSHLIKRDDKIKGRRRLTRFERGRIEDLLMISEKLRTYPIQFKVFIVVPGLSKKAVNDAVLELLSSTENHLMNTCKSSLGVIASP